MLLLLIVMVSGETMSCPETHPSMTINFVTPQNPGCPLTTRQPAENLYVSYRETHT